jgi:putative tryptophan/tyrosine transport system substrate-binding protein
VISFANGLVIDGDGHMTVGLNRRNFLVTLGGAVAIWPLMARAQRRELRLGVLTSVPPTTSPGPIDALREGLSQRGYVEGRNLMIEYRWPTERLDRMDELAADLVRSNADIILAWTSRAVIAARRATSTIPIVMVGIADAVGMGFVDSLARPGGNITGVSDLARDINAKVLETLVEAVPGIRRLGLVRNPDNQSAEPQSAVTQDTARALGVDLETADGKTPEEFADAFRRLSADGVKGVVFIGDPSLIEHRRRIAELAQSAGLATAFVRRENVEAGGLLSYGPNLNSEFVRAADYIDRIAKGANPADLPVEQPVKFELVINLKTAKALGLTVPRTLLARADDVIE